MDLYQRKREELTLFSNGDGVLLIISSAGVLSRLSSPTGIGLLPRKSGGGVLLFRISSLGVECGIVRR